MITHADMAELVELYALDALVGREFDEFESHLEFCEPCQSQLAVALNVTASLVPDSDPPTHLWDLISDEIGPAQATIAELPRRTGLIVALTSVAAGLAIALGGVIVAQNSLSPEEALIAAAQTAADAPGSTTADFVVDGVTVAEVVLGTEGIGYILPTEALVELDESRTYQLWIINEEELVISGGVLGHAPRVSTFTWTDGVSGFALTREVAGGVEISEGDIVAVATDV
ncbi:MAG TPA: anti-sigma factor [Acidimicrobiia bacterium]